MNFLRRIFSRNKKNPIENKENQGIIMNFRLVFNNTEYKKSLLCTFSISNLKEELERRFQLAETWELVYSTHEHGFSLKTMVSCINNGKPPYILICEDDNNNLFGVFFSDKIETKKGAYGRPNTFLFKIKKNSEKNSSFSRIRLKKQNKDKEICTYKSTGNNSYFSIWDPDFLAFGCSGGRYGLYFNSNMQTGESYRVVTFDNEPLAKDVNFKISRVEVWSINL